MPTHDTSLPHGIALATHPTKVGDLVLAASDDSLLYCGFAGPDMVRKRLSKVTRRVADEPADIAPGQADVLARTREQVDAYLAGHRRDFCLPVDLRLATPFCKEVVQSVGALVPYGRTTTYADLAHRLNRPKAARAVGAALGANPVCVVLPCHRVVGASGRLSGYAGGIPAKEFLLALEADA